MFEAVVMCPVLEYVLVKIDTANPDLGSEWQLFDNKIKAHREAGDFVRFAKTARLIDPGNGLPYSHNAYEIGSKNVASEFCVDVVRGVDISAIENDPDCHIIFEVGVVDVELPIRNIPTPHKERALNIFTKAGISENQDLNLAALVTNLADIVKQRDV